MKDNRTFINAVFWILRTGAPWRDLPPDYGDWKNTHRRFYRWRDKGLWESLLEKLVLDPDFEWLMIDASPIKIHAHARRKGQKPRHGPHKRRLNTKLHLAVDAHGMPIRAVVTAGLTADCTQTPKRIEGLYAAHLLAGRGYDSDDIVIQVQDQGMVPVIPYRKNRKVQYEHDKNIYKLRHLVENAFLHLKQWRGMATPYAKNSTSFLTAVHIRCLVLWLNIS